MGRSRNSMGPKVPEIADRDEAVVEWLEQSFQLTEVYRGVVHGCAVGIGGDQGAGQCEQACTRSAEWARSVVQFADGCHRDILCLA